jgi:glycolate oxidase FAD binding subunit
MSEFDLSKSLQDAVRTAAAAKSRLAIRGSGSKHFLTGEIPGTPLDVTGHRGVVSYEPSELVLTARAGTSLGEIEALLARHNQMLAFEPPYFGANATLGGTLACGLSGPRRPYTGSARDFVLGMKIINGRGEALKFGGQVMKNVAGYDISRLMVGAFGTLGVLLEASLKVLPRPETEVTLRFDVDPARAIGQMNAWAGQPLPLSAAAHVDQSLYIRMSGSEAAVRSGRSALGGEAVPDGNAFWENLREQRLHFFAGDAPLWRLSVPPATAPVPLAGACLIDWGGAQRWLKSEVSSEQLASAMQVAGGHARLFRGPRAPGPILPTAPETLQHLWHDLRRSFDTDDLFNQGLAPG